MVRLWAGPSMASPRNAFATGTPTRLYPIWMAAGIVWTGRDDTHENTVDYR